METFVRESAASSTDDMEQVLLMDLTFLLKLTSDLYWRMYSAPEHNSLSGALPNESLDFVLDLNEFNKTSFVEMKTRDVLASN